MGELTIDLEIVKIKIGDEIYPEQLRKIKNPPKQLYLKGNIELLKQNCIAIIGSRSCTKKWRKFSKKNLHQNYQGKVLLLLVEWLKELMQ